MMSWPSSFRAIYQAHTAGLMLNCTCHALLHYAAARRALLCYAALPCLPLAPPSSSIRPRMVICMCTQAYGRQLGYHAVCLACDSAQARDMLERL